MAALTKAVLTCLLACALAVPLTGGPFTPRRAVAAAAATSAAPAVPELTAPEPTATAGGTTAVDARENAIAKAIVRIINTERGKHHAAPVKMNAELVAAAHTHNLAMSKANTMAHRLPGEPALSKRVLAAGYDFQNVGENLGYNSNISLAGAKQLQQMMYAEGRPPAGQLNHYANIVNPKFQQVGVDIYFDRAHQRLWLTEELARPFPK